MARRALAKSKSIFGLTWVWPTPASSYSIGSSTVMMLACAASSICSAAYKVVVLPEPVGPVTSTMPCGCWINCSKLCKVWPCMPTACSVRRLSLLSSKRSTARSPCAPGKVDTRTSMARWPKRKEMRPSCGRRFSAMSKSAMIFKREISAACKARFGVTTSRSVPSMRKRTLEWRSYASM